MQPSALPFFLPASPGARFCLYHAPRGVARHAVVFVHAFAEEMNKSRRMVALQARALSLLGVAVLTIDLYGCGDSDGDFGDARWDIWKDDLAAAVRWLKSEVDAPVSLWGQRLGALLALDFAGDSGERFDRFVLWQPVASGETFMTQFLRLKVAAEMLAGGQTGTSKLRARLAGGEPLEVAGYSLAPELVAAIDRQKLAPLARPGNRIHWLEVVSEAGRELTPVAARIVEAWRAVGAEVDVACVPGESFWTTQEITECPALVAATSRIFEK